MMDHEMPNGQGGTMPRMMMNGTMQRKMDRVMASMMQNKDSAPANKV